MIKKIINSDDVRVLFINLNSFRVFKLNIIFY